MGYLCLCAGRKACRSQTNQTDFPKTGNIVLWRGGVSAGINQFLQPEDERWDGSDTHLALVLVSPGWQPHPQCCGRDSGAHLANLSHRLGLDDAAEELEAELIQLEDGQVADH